MFKSNDTGILEVFNNNQQLISTHNFIIKNDKQMYEVENDLLIDFNLDNNFIIRHNNNDKIIYKGQILVEKINNDYENYYKYYYHGEGILTLEYNEYRNYCRFNFNGTYVGTFEFNAFNGFGTLYKSFDLEKQSRYEGEFTYGDIIYSGNFEENDLMGKGTYYEDGEEPISSDHFYYNTFYTNLSYSSNVKLDNYTGYAIKYRFRCINGICKKPSLQ